VSVETQRALQGDGQITSGRIGRRLSAVLAADLAGYSRLMGRDEEGTLARLMACRQACFDPKIAEHHGRIVKTTGDGLLVDFGSAVDAVRCAVEIQGLVAKSNAGVPNELRFQFRIGIHVGDIIIDEQDMFGDGVNIAARLEGIAEPGGVCISDDAYRQIRGKVEIAYDDMGPQELKNIAEPVRAWRARPENTESSIGRHEPIAHFDTPSIAVLPFQNMSGDAEQEYLADGIVEDVLTELARFRSLNVVARNSSFVYKGQAVDIKRVGRELGARYILEGSVRKAGKRIRVTSQLIDTMTGAHIWAEHFDGDADATFDRQDDITRSVIGALATSLERAETERAKKRPTAAYAAYDHFLVGMAAIYEGTRASNARALDHFAKATTIDPNFSAAYAMSCYCYVWRKASGWPSGSNEITLVGSMVCPHQGACRSRRSRRSGQPLRSVRRAGAAARDRRSPCNCARRGVFAFTDYRHVGLHRRVGPDASGAWPRRAPGMDGGSGVSTHPTRARDRQADVHAHSGRCQWHRRRSRRSGRTRPLFSYRRATAPARVALTHVQRDSHPNKIGERSRAHFSHNSASVDLNGDFAKFKLAGNLLVHLSRGYKLHDFLLSNGERFETLPKTRVFRFGRETNPISFDGSRNRIEHILLAKRLCKKIDGTGFHSTNRHGYITMASHQHHRQMDSVVSKPGLEIQPIHARQSYVENETSRRVRSGSIQEIRYRSIVTHPETVRPKKAVQGEP